MNLQSWNVVDDRKRNHEHDRQACDQDPRRNLLIAASNLDRAEDNSGGPQHCPSRGKGETGSPLLAVSGQANARRGKCGNGDPEPTKPIGDQKIGVPLHRTIATPPTSEIVEEPSRSAAAWLGPIDPKLRQGGIWRRRR